MEVDREKSVCEWAGANPVPPLPNAKLGVAFSTLGLGPINGMRVSPVGDESGWYIWCGVACSEDQDFFTPLCVEHLDRYLPEAVEYLDLPPGYRFLIDLEGFEDVWFDHALISPAA